jgi:hypothetical protein
MNNYTLICYQPGNEYSSGEYHHVHLGGLEIFDSIDEGMVANKWGEIMFYDAFNKSANLAEEDHKITILKNGVLLQPGELITYPNFSSRDMSGFIRADHEYNRIHLLAQDKFKILSENKISLDKEKQLLVEKEKVTRSEQAKLAQEKAERTLYEKLKAKFSTDSNIVKD